MAARGVVIDSAPLGSNGASKSRGKYVGTPPPPPAKVIAARIPKMKGKVQPGADKNPVPKGKIAPPGKKLRAAELEETPTRRTGHTMAAEFAAATNKSAGNHATRDQKTNTASEQEENDSDADETRSINSDNSVIEQLHLNPNMIAA